MTELRNLTAADVSAMVDDILAGRLSMLDLIRSAPRGDYFAHVQMTRLHLVLSHDPRVVAAFVQDLKERMGEQGREPDDLSIHQELSRKDAMRRFPKLQKELARARDEQPSLLNGADWDECLAQYKRLISHVEKLWDDACKLYRADTYPIAAFLSILVIEEIGKLANLWADLVAYDAPYRTTQGMPIDRDHRRKHFIGVVSGALINARLDRVLGKETIRKVLHEAESDELERTRQACLYIDVVGGQPTTPAERISDSRARVLVVLAGELMAEVLGHFPWEFERMLNNVISFERAIGFPERKIRR